MQLCVHTCVRTAGMAGALSGKTNLRGVWQNESAGLREVKRCCTRGWCCMQRRMSLCATGADGTHGTSERASVPGLHKTMRRNFPGLSRVRSPHRFLPPLQFVCRQPGLARPSCLDDRARLPNLAVQSMAVGVNYGTGSRGEETLASAERRNLMPVKIQRHVRRPDACATQLVGYRLHHYYTSSIVIELVALQLLGRSTCRQALYARLGRNDSCCLYRYEGGDADEYRIWAEETTTTMTIPSTGKSKSHAHTTQY